MSKRGISPPRIIQFVFFDEKRQHKLVEDVSTPDYQKRRDRRRQKLIQSKNLATQNASSTSSKEIVFENPTLEQEAFSRDVDSCSCFNFFSEFNDCFCSSIPEFD